MPVPSNISGLKKFKEVFAIQSQVAQEIAHQLNAKLTTEEKKKIEKKPTDNPPGL